MPYYEGNYFPEEVDRYSGPVSTIKNGDQHHIPGACNSLKELDNRQIDAVVIGGSCAH